jgi:hypothetical protein
MGVEPRDFYNNLSGYASYLAGQPFDAPAFANELELVIVGPLRHAQELFDRNPYFTRLYTSLSAEEMTVDPVFAFNSELGDVDNVHRATGLMLCADANSGGSDAPVTITLLFEDPLSEPIKPLPFTTLPPLLMTRLLLLPSRPKMRLRVLVQVDPVPVTSTLLFEELVVRPI